MCEVNCIVCHMHHKLNHEGGKKNAQHKLLLLHVNTHSTYAEVNEDTQHNMMFTHRIWLSKFELI